MLPNDIVALIYEYKLSLCIAEINDTINNGVLFRQDSDLEFNKKAVHWHILGPSTVSFYCELCGEIPFSFRPLIYHDCDCESFRFS